jgi:ubiquinol-cytochrome c reductase cytochrome b subunit
MQINPIWMYGPYDPSKVSAGSQPDWYMGWLEGGLRIMPNWEISALGVTLSLNVLIPGLALMGLLFTVLGAYPFIEHWITGDNREHHLLDRPRNQPTRTGFGVAGMTAYAMLWVAGGNDIIATTFGLSIEAITWVMRFALFIMPVLAFIVARRWCISLQRHDREMVLHGYETGVIVRSPTGAYSEIHAPINHARAFTLTSQERQSPRQLSEAVDENGVAAPRHGIERVRAKLSSFWFADAIQKPTAAELAEAAHHSEADGLPAANGHHKGIETVGQVGGEPFDLEGSTKHQ